MRLPYPAPCFLHDDRARVVYKSGSLYAMPQPADSGVLLHVELASMCATTGKGTLQDSQFFGTDSSQEAMNMWVRNRQLRAITEDEANDLWARYARASTAR